MTEQMEQLQKLKFWYAFKFPFTESFNSSFIASLVEKDSLTEKQTPVVENMIKKFYIDSFLSKLNLENLDVLFLDGYDITTSLICNGTNEEIECIAFYDTAEKKYYSPKYIMENRKKLKQKKTLPHAIN